MASLTLRSITNARVDALAAGDDIGGAVPLGRVIDETIERARVLLHRAGAIRDEYRVGLGGHGWTGWTMPSRLSRRECGRVSCRERVCQNVESRMVAGSFKKTKKL